MRKKSIPTKRGRKKLLSNIPTNYNFWCCTIANSKELQQFLERGNEQQKNYIIRTLNYMRKFNREQFEKVNGEDWLIQFQKDLHEN